MHDRPVIFLAFANDQSNYLYKLTEEQHRIREALDRVSREGLCEVIYETDADLQRIWANFNRYQDRIAIFHYGGHADDYALLLKKADGDPQLAHGAGLVSFLGQQKGLQLVFINGCSTKRQAEELVERGVPAVIGTSEPVNDSAATELSVTFYESLAAGRSLQQAWLGARDMVRAQRGDHNFQRGIILNKQPNGKGLGFPWEMYLRPGAEQVQDWNLPRAAQNPLFGLPLPQHYLLHLPKAPFVGLHYFQEKDAALFFGRGAQIRELYNHLKGIHPIILMYGKSGVGKSSLLDAGLGPRIKDLFKVLYKRRKQEKGLLGTLESALDEALSGLSSQVGPLADIDQEDQKTDPQAEARELLQAAVKRVNNPQLQKQLERMLEQLQVQQPSRPEVELQGLLKKWQSIEQQSGQPLVVILDQVEEKFTRPMPEAGSARKDELVSFLLAIRPLFNGPQSGIRGKLIFSYRKEYHPEIRDTFRSMSLPYAQLFLKRLDREGIMEAIRGVNQNVTTRQKYLLEVEGNLPEIIADDLVEDPESPIAPVLQIILVKLWETAFIGENEPVRFTVRQYQELRKQGTTMGEFFLQQREILEQKQPQAVQSGLALDLLQAHTTSMGTSGSCMRKDLFQRYELARDELVSLLDNLERLSLLNNIGSENNETSGTLDDNYKTILAHDTLAPVVIREFTISDAPGQRAIRILNNKMAEVSFQLSPEYLDKLRHQDLAPEILSELGETYVGRDKFLSILRDTLNEETFRNDRDHLLESAIIGLAPNEQAVYLDEADLAIVEQGSGLKEGTYPGMRKLSRAEELLVADSQQRREERIQKQEQIKKRERRSIRIQQIFTGVTLVLFLVAAIAGVIAYQNQQEAEKNLEEVYSIEASKVSNEIMDIIRRSETFENGPYQDVRRQLLLEAQDSLKVFEKNENLDWLRDTIQLLLK